MSEGSIAGYTRPLEERWTPLSDPRETSKLTESTDHICACDVLRTPPIPDCASGNPLQSKKANFDATHELEELLLEDNPLKAKKRNPKNDISTMSAEMRLMEENFTIYDHTAMARKCEWAPRWCSCHPSEARSVRMSPSVGH